MHPNIAYILPKRRHATWTPDPEPLDLGCEEGVGIPLLGYVTAGRPVEMPEDHDTITVPRHMTRKTSYALRVRGHSMIDDQIQDGDIIVIEQRQTAENGETVVALINGQQVTLKRFYVEARGGPPPAGQSRDGAAVSAARRTANPRHRLRGDSLRGVTPGIRRRAYRADPRARGHRVRLGRRLPTMAPTPPTLQPGGTRWTTTRKGINDFISRPARPTALRLIAVLRRRALR